MCCNLKDCCKGNCACSVSKLSYVLMVVGAVNWGLIGLALLLGHTATSWNLVHVLFGRMPGLEAFIYVLVGFAGVMAITGCSCKKCKSGVCTVHGEKK